MSFVGIFKEVVSGKPIGNPMCIGCTAKNCKMRGKAGITDCFKSPNVSKEERLKKLKKYQ